MVQDDSAQLCFQSSSSPILTIDCLYNTPLGFHLHWAQEVDPQKKSLIKFFLHTAS